MNPARHYSNQMITAWGPGKISPSLKLEERNSARSGFAELVTSQFPFDAENAHRFDDSQAIVFGPKRPVFWLEVFLPPFQNIKSGGNRGLVFVGRLWQRKRTSVEVGP